MQLGFLRVNSPLDCLPYFPSFEIGKRVSSFANDDLGRCPKNPQPFEKGWRKLSTTVVVSSGVLDKEPAGEPF